jgi:ankyrin repeat protein
MWLNTFSSASVIIWPSMCRVSTVFTPGHMQPLLAATKGHVEVIDVLLAHDEPLDDVGCYTPVLGAVAKSQWQAVVILLHAGARIEADCQSNQLRVGDAFSNFARRGQLDLLEQFLEAGVPVDLRNQRKTTALAAAVTADRIEVVKFLLAAGANPDERTADDTPLVANARSMGFLEVERELKQAPGGIMNK